MEVISTDTLSRFQRRLNERSVSRKREIFLDRLTVDAHGSLPWPHQNTRHRGLSTPYGLNLVQVFSPNSLAGDRIKWLWAL
ncbi:uncharacterized protein METZ01_LOCUS401888, partial [marine metagenome]